VRFEITQRFGAPAEEVLGLYCDPDFYGLLDGIGRIGAPEVLDRAVDGSRITMRVRFRFTGDLPSAALAVVRPERLTWVEHTTFDTDAATSSTRIAPDHYADRLQASARSRFVDHDEGCRREVAGDLKVHALLVGGQVERAIVDGMREHLAAEADVANRRLGVVGG
jgi:hypothetical protein